MCRNTKETLKKEQAADSRRQEIAKAYNNFIQKKKPSIEGFKYFVRWVGLHRDRLSVVPDSFLRIGLDSFLQRSD